MARTTTEQGSKGIVFDIQRFSLHDGPGIRTTVFLKGCPLRCLWCSNPESQSGQPSLLASDVSCRSCGVCAEACPQTAITLSPESGRIIDRGRCDLCMRCVSACRYQALITCGKPMGVGEVVEEVLKDRIFYRNSGGGVTLSGGEALQQSAFARAVLQRCKSEGLHTVLDTSGHAPFDALRAVLPFVDLLLFDLKHLEPDIHRRATGVDGSLILANLSRAAALCPTWLRIPLIAGFNDSIDHSQKVALLAKRLELQTISLLPYHQGGKAKCDQLGRTYPFPDARAPGDEHICELKGLLEREGLRVTVGR